MKSDFFPYAMLFCPGPGLPAEVVYRESGPCLNTSSKTELYDTVVCGGTLGIFFAVALARQGLKVAIIERGRLQGVRYGP
jgi:NAD(P)H-nitrite reductase large subunit